MNIERTYQFEGLLTIKKSHVLLEEALPQDDVLPWLFLVMDKEGKRRFTFIYKIKQPAESFYEKPFHILMSFIMDGIEKNVELNQTYDVWRGEECVGNVSIIKNLIGGHRL